MGELIFTICYGGALIVLGFITKASLMRMEREVSQIEKQEHSIPTQNQINY